MTHDTAPRIVRVSIPTPFPVGPVNAYLVLGSSASLVDTGPNTAEAIDVLSTALAREGLRPADLDQVVLTHAHADHVGLVAWLREQGAGPVRVHAQDRPAVEDPGGPHDQSLPGHVEVARRHGVPPKVVDEAMVFYAHILSVMRGAPAEELDPGAPLKLGGAPFRILETPGHSSGSVCYLHEATRTLLSGDMLLPTISTNSFFKGGAPDSRLGLVWFRRSLASLVELAPARVYPGHGAPFTDAGRVLAELREAHRERQERIEEVFDAEGPLTAYDLSLRLFPEAAREGRWLAFAEVLGHLEVMEEDGRVRQAGGRWVRSGVGDAPSPRAPA
ncbi:MAG: MBL fold metallo-hydrolase [Candidatus Eisenbacteria bacterium]